MLNVQLKMATAIATILITAASSFAAPTVTGLTARQRYPWNGLVDISFNLSENGCIAIAATNTATGVAVPVRTLHDKNGNAVEEYTRFASGEVSLVWNAGTDVPETLIETLALSIVGAQHGRVQLWAGGPYWATENIGADKPEDYGLYFWWGDTVGYRREGDAWVASDGSSSNFSFSSDNTPTDGKNTATLQSEGWITADGVLVPEHDAAHVQWGDAWRMPTMQELNALRNNCNWTWMTQKGVRGYVVRGRGDYASYSIFLPAAGFSYATCLGSVGSYGNYLSSIPLSDGDRADMRAYELEFYSGDYRADYAWRDFGYSIRPVQWFVQ